jgi:hypothetical protein
MSLVYDKQNDRLVPKGSLPPKRAHFGTGPAVITDEMPPTRNMVDGKYYTSKRAFESEVRARGNCEIVGNEDIAKHTPPPADPTLDIIDDVQRAWSELGGDA